jgi:hypothetical protein
MALSLPQTQSYLPSHRLIFFKNRSQVNLSKRFSAGSFQIRDGLAHVAASRRLRLVVVHAVDEVPGLMESISSISFGQKFTDKMVEHKL